MGINLRAFAYTCKCFVTAFFIFGSVFTSATANELPCFDSNIPPFSEIDISLIQTSADSDGIISGIFRISNRSISEVLIIKGRLYAGVLWVERPFSVTEFRDLNGIWQTYIGVMGEDVGPLSDKVEVRPGTELQVHLTLFSRKVMKNVTADFRIVLPVTFDSENICFNSTPFSLRNGRILHSKSKGVKGGI